MNLREVRPGGRKARAQAADRSLRRLWIGQRREARSARVPRLLHSLAGVDLDISTHNVLIALADGAPMRLTDLARRTGTDLSTVSRQVGLPEALGMTTRRPGPPDERGQLIDLTPAGRRVVGRLMKAWDGILDSALEGFTDAELIRFEGALTRFLSALDREVSAQAERMQTA